MAVLSPSCTAVTTSSRESSTPGTAGSENDLVPGRECRAREPVPVPAVENRCGRCLASQASTLCGAPGAIHHSALSTRSGVPGIWAGALSTPLPRSGRRRAAALPSAPRTRRGWHSRRPPPAGAGSASSGRATWRRSGGAPVDPVRTLAGSVGRRVRGPAPGQRDRDRRRRGPVRREQWSGRRRRLREVSCHLDGGAGARGSACLVPTWPRFGSAGRCWDSAPCPASGVRCPAGLAPTLRPVARTVSRGGRPA